MSNTWTIFHYCWGYQSYFRPYGATCN